MTKEEVANNGYTIIPFLTPTIDRRYWPYNDAAYVKDLLASIRDVERLTKELLTERPGDERVITWESTLAKIKDSWVYQEP